MTNNLKLPLEYKCSPEFTGVWDRDSKVVFSMITNGGDRAVFKPWACQIAATNEQLEYVTACVNALAMLEDLHKNLDGLDADESWAISHSDNGYFVFMVWFEDGEPQCNGDDETYFETYTDAINHAYELAKKYYPELDWRH